MRINSINTQSFRGFLVIPRSHVLNGNKTEIRKTYPELTVNTDDIVEINNNINEVTVIKYNKNGEVEKHFFYNGNDPHERNRILLAYAAAAASKDVIVKA